jgi:gluconate 5-dehydrogenase
MSLDLFDLTGKTALVTGATHGLGMAMAIGLARAGANLVVNDIAVDKIENARKEYRALGISVNTYLFDVTDEKQIIEYLARREKEVAPIDILVNNGC